jgi:bifunctional UDP-N-acetylglucosamine pyrophosphorylase/glucosamine-1-phosphate N-acetyltransferase
VISYHIIILAAGKGTRMRSPLPKVLHPLAGFPLIWHVLRLAESLNPMRITCVISPDLQDFFSGSPHRIILQDPPKGTGHAVEKALENAPDLADAPTLVLYGDTPLLTASTVQALLDLGGDMGLLTFRGPLPNPYGRVLCKDDGNAARIIESSDLSPAQKQNPDFPLNAGIMAFRGRILPNILPRLRPHNQQGEVYLTDTVALIDGDGGCVRPLSVAAEEVLGINTQQELQTAETVIQARLLKHHQDAGVIAGPSVVFSADTVLAPGTHVHPYVVFGPSVRVDEGAIIHSFSHLAGCAIERGATVGPFARLRPGTIVGEASHIGNFVELKAATLGKGVKAGHLSYLGDASIGDDCNIGAGTITCNYDGTHKHKTILESGVFVGSHSALVAPVTVHQGAYLGAGSVITQDVPKDTLAITRPALTTVPHWSQRRKKDTPSS